MNTQNRLQTLTFIFYSFSSFVAYTTRLPSEGETVFGKSFAKSYGGKGANQAVMVARLGGKTNFIGKVGCDSFGSDYISQFVNEGVNAESVSKCEQSTGIACISVDDAGKNTIVIIPGANLELNKEDVLSYSSLFSSRSVLVCQNEIPTISTVAALSLARSVGMLSIWNPAPAPTTATMTLDELNCILSLADLICPNENELGTLTNMPTSSLDEVRTAAQSLLERGCQTVVVTLGEKGACLVTPHTFQLFPAMKVNTIDTVGAGDAFIGKLKMVAFLPLHRFPSLLICDRFSSPSPPRHPPIRYHGVKLGARGASTRGHRAGHLLRLALHL